MQILNKMADGEGQFDLKGRGWHVVWIVVVLLVIFGSFVVVGAGERGVVITLGKVEERIMTEGLNFKLPIIQSVKKLDIKTQKEEVVATAASKDLQTVTAKVALNYHLDAVNVNHLWQSIGSEYKVRIIDPAIQEAVKAVTANYTAEELITKRPQVKDDAKLALRERLTAEYIIVDELSIVDFDFSLSFNQAIEAKGTAEIDSLNSKTGISIKESDYDSLDSFIVAKVTAEQNALAAKNKLEQVKYEAEQRVTTAKGEAEAIRIQAQAIQQQGGAAYVNLKAVEKWNGTLPTYMLGDTVPFVNLR